MQLTVSHVGLNQPCAICIGFGCWAQNNDKGPHSQESALTLFTLHNICVCRVSNPFWPYHLDHINQYDKLGMQSALTEAYRWPF